MDKVFVKKGELELINGGYLVLKKDQTPVFNEEFVQAQLNAEYAVELIKVLKTKDFEGKKCDDLASTLAEFDNNFLKQKTVSYVENGSAPKLEIKDGLAKEAMAFIKHEGSKIDNQKINNELQRFNVINEFETFGLFFEPKISKLNKIYEMEEIVEAVKDTVKLSK